MIAELEATCQPSDPAFVQRAIASLLLTCKTRNRSHDDQKAQIAAYAKFLTKYPPDAFVAMVENCPFQWFPSRVEMEDFLRAWVQPRKRMIKALQDGPPKKEEPREPITNEKRKRADEMLKAVGMAKQVKGLDRYRADMTPDERQRADQITSIMDQIAEADERGDEAECKRLRAILGDLQGASAPEAGEGTSGPE